MTFIILDEDLLNSASQRLYAARTGAPYPEHESWALSRALFECIVSEATPAECGVAGLATDSNPDYSLPRATP